MNREIKFRVYNLNQKKFLTHACYFNHLNFNEFTCYDRWFKTDEENVILQQYTGLKDKNSKEIYEGDIVKFRYEIHEHEFEEDIGEVYFENGIFYFDRNLAFATNDCNFDESSLQVIGNIFENKELLK